MSDGFIVRVTLRHAGRDYTYNEPWSREVGETDRDRVSGVSYMYEEGNYSCDCNRSLFIGRYCDDDFPEMPCGDTIELVSLTFPSFEYELVGGIFVPKIRG